MPRNFRSNLFVHPLSYFCAELIKQFPKRLGSLGAILPRRVGQSQLQKHSHPHFRNSCRAVYDAGFSPICPALFLPLFLNDAVPEEHKSSIDIGRDLLRRSRVLVVCGHTVTESMKNDIAVAQRLGITATTLEGILTVKGQGHR